MFFNKETIDAKVINKQFNTVDELVDFFISIDSENDDISAISHILSDYNVSLLNMLNKKTTRPSKYDLLIIKIINEGPIVKKFKYLLNAYKKRGINNETY